ncbi:MAG: AAA family ATPase [Chloroflexi bacterium]|jgi:very-short-patch-repair endonuclease|nr:AAA family ATPase [Chloroflexota bacterium]MBT7081889.1 AAA family ATPase [Chloroflexota bacterium]MBT7288927.1 AAA family ATPase [Chloroflexota bacterium]
MNDQLHDEGQDNSLMARVCQYYLDCIKQDADVGISVYATNKYSLDYCSLDSLPLIDDNEATLFQDEAARALLTRLLKDRNKLKLYLGYPTRLKAIQSKKGETFFKVEPVLLFPLELDATDHNASPTIDSDIPQLNFEVLRSLITIGSGNFIDEAIQLSEELGFNNQELELPGIDEICSKLKSVRSHWDWREEIDPHNLSSDIPLSRLNKQGIYNRAVLVLVEGFRYTQGLETELTELSKVNENNYKDTSLGFWLSEEQSHEETLDQQPLLEVLPLNNEQRQAVTQGLTSRLTVITGPPGTGKSQVVTSLLANAAWRGMKVLFASKNNKAVDVVETRVNALGPRPILVRVGANKYQEEFSKYLISLLAATTTDEDQANYDDQMNKHLILRKRFESIDAAVEQVMELRNKVDQAEQQVEHVRTDIGDDLFQQWRYLDIRDIAPALITYRKEVNKLNPKNRSLFTRLFWGMIKSKHYLKLCAIAKESIPHLSALGIDAPTAEPSDETIKEWLQFGERLSNRIEYLGAVKDYFILYNRLQFSDSLEELSRKRSELLNDLADSSEKLWRYWLLLQPSRLTSADRKLLSEYSALVQVMLSSSEKNNIADRQVRQRYNSLRPRIAHILSCWAVTSLSARGRIPFEPNFFDLVVIDEASQCDIASALPLLYRAKSAVIIGDPKQLKHISSIAQKQDFLLLTKHNMSDGYASWLYSVQSLFDLASSLCERQNIILLRDHHRSHKDIIGFSNEFFYEGRLRVATNYNKLKPMPRNEPIVRWCDVKGKVERPFGQGALNLLEARSVVREIERLVLEQEYQGSIGVVSPFRAQANKIRELVEQNKVLARRLDDIEFLADTVHRFQGDERDLMIFSPVVSVGLDDKQRWFLQNNFNLFNVAITRARSALVVVGDQSAASNSGIDYLEKFAEYIDKLGDTNVSDIEEHVDHGPEYPKVSAQATVSDWEKVFYRALYRAGVRSTPQFGVDQYHLDLAVFSDSRKLDVEIDGERYHRNWDGELCRRDQIRNQRLMELGWDVMRFWVYQIREDISDCITKVKKWINNQDNS